MMSIEEKRLERNKYMSEWYKRPENRAKKNLANRLYRQAKRDKVHEWESKSRQKARDRGALRDRKLKARYGITLEQYNEMLKSQDHVCRLCNQQEKSDYMLAVDHCHKTGRVRGLLCNSCNARVSNYESKRTIVNFDINKIKNYLS